VIGAPGSLDRRGSLHKNNIAKSLFDDTQWYDDPDDDDLPEEHPSLDDYLGVSFYPRRSLAILFIYFFIIFELFDVQQRVTLKSKLGVIEGHWKRHHSIDRIRTSSYSSLYLWPYTVPFLRYWSKNANFSYPAYI